MPQLSLPLLDSGSVRVCTLCVCARGSPRLFVGASERWLIVMEEEVSECLQRKKKETRTRSEREGDDVPNAVCDLNVCVEKKALHLGRPCWEISRTGTALRSLCFTPKSAGAAANRAPLSSSFYSYYSYQPLRSVISDFLPFQPLFLSPPFASLIHLIPR